MIIRAASDDEDDDGGHLTGSVFGSEPSAPPRESALALHSAKLAWIGATLALVVLLLVDLAAIMSHFQRQLANEDSADQTGTRDPFALLPALLDAWVSSSSGTGSTIVGSIFASPATAVNNLLGFVGVAAWIVSRETSAQVKRGRRSASASLCATGSPWTLVAGIFCFGHVVSCGYVLLALLESNGDRSKFFLGRASASRTHPRV